MEKEFIPYEIALAVKKLGFDENCFGYYKSQGKELVFIKIKNSIISNWEDSFMEFSQCSVPTYQQAFRWFREKYGYDVSIVRRTVKAYKFEIQKLVYEGNDYFFSVFSFDSHQKAELECLKKLIEIVTNKN